VFESDAPVGPAMNVIVNVDSEPWQLASSFAESGPDDRAFTVTQTPDGSALVQSEMAFTAHSRRLEVR